jgi:hypothetical protein
MKQSSTTKSFQETKENQNEYTYIKINLFEDSTGVFVHERKTTIQITSFKDSKTRLMLITKTSQCRGTDKLLGKRILFEPKISQQKRIIKA